MEVYYCPKCLYDRGFLVKCKECGEIFCERCKPFRCKCGNDGEIINNWQRIEKLTGWQKKVINKVINKSN